LRDAATALSAAGLDNVRFEARLLLSHAAGLGIEELIARGDREAPPTVVETLRRLTARRVAREPMAYVLGEKEFWGLTFAVSPAVLVPRPDSETVIEATLALLPDRRRDWRVLDLGLGSGCLLLTLLHEYPAAEGVGLEASGAALAVAEANAERLGVAGRARLVLGDWRQVDWQATLGGPFDLLVSNPPYIPDATVPGLMPEVSRFEPRLALEGGPDGLAAYRAIAAGAGRLMVSGGYLLLEVGQGQALEVYEIFRREGFQPRPPWKDLAGMDRVVALQH